MSTVVEIPTVEYDAIACMTRLSCTHTKKGVTMYFMIFRAADQSWASRGSKEFENQPASYYDTSRNRISSINLARLILMFRTSIKQSSKMQWTMGNI